MYARLINILFRPETLEDVKHRFRSVSIPLISAHEGFSGLLATTNERTGRIYLLTMWDTEEHLDSSSVHPDFMQNMASFAPWMAGGFNRESFEVLEDTLHDLAGGDPHSHAITRFTFVQTSQNGWEETTEALRRLVHPDEYPEAGFGGALLLGSLAGEKQILIDIWETRDQIVNTDGVIFNTAHHLQQSGAITSVPTHDVVIAVSRI